MTFRGSVRLLGASVLLPATGALDPYQTPKEKLLSSYQFPTTRPNIAAEWLRSSSFATRAKAPADVIDVQVYVENMRALDETTQTWGIDGYFRAWWYDQRLRFNETDEDLQLNREESPRIWKPDLYWEHTSTVELPHREYGYEKGAGEMCAVRYLSATLNPC